MLHIRRCAYVSAVAVGIRGNGMEEDKKPDNNLEDLRRRAETRVQDARLDQDVSKLSEEDVRSLAHELQVHQAELEIQNEELRRAQNELKESRDKYIDLYDLSPVGHFTLNRAGLIQEANLSGARLVNRERRGLIQQAFALLVSVEDHAVFFSHLEKVFQMPVKQICELKLQDSGQQPIWVRLESIAAPGEEGKLETCRVAVSDISEAKRAEAQILMTQAQVLSSMAEGVCVCDETGRVSFTNAAFEEMFGYKRGEFLLSKEVFDFEDRPEGGPPTVLSDAFSQALKNGHWRGDLVARKADGSHFEAHLRLTRLQLFGNMNIVCVWENISALKQWEKALRDSERRFRAVFEGAQDLIFLKDESLKYTHVNPAFAKLFGKAPADIVGSKYEDLFGPEGAEYERDLDTRVLGGQTIEEERVRNIKGVTRRFNEVRTPLRDREGNVSGLCAIARDVTERGGALRQLLHEAAPPRSKIMQETLQLALKAAASGGLVLLQGESGSGKDYMARFIHEHSDRSGGPYFSINCAAIPHELAEAELFGYERGAFTGAHSRKRGLLELAEGGTLLLNEIGDLSLPLQAKLLTFLDTKRFTRVGGEQEISVNARLMFATNKELDAEVEEGRFRQDLFYRINVMTISVPPLRDRIEDIQIIAQEIMSELAKELRLTEVPPIDPASQVALTGYDWPGNVRELRNVLERSLMLSEGQSLKLTLPALTASAQAWSITSRFPSGARSLHDVTDEVIESLCREALRRSGGNRRKAARILRISRDSLYRYLKRFDLESENRTTNETDD
jgi:two-component system, NtrC family, response regulator AtoC